MACQGTHISERYHWMILKLCQIKGLMLGLLPVIFPSLVNFVYPRSFSAALSFLENGRSDLRPRPTGVVALTVQSPSVRFFLCCAASGGILQPF